MGVARRFGQLADVYRRCAAVAALTVASLVLATGARAYGGLDETRPVIAPGQEALLAEMLGRGATLPGECTFAGAQIERTFIRSAYGCPQGRIVFELGHPHAAPAGAPATARFVVQLKSGTPPAGLLDWLLSRLRSRETDFEWQTAASSTRGSSRVGLEALFGAGEEAHAFWLLTIRVNILLFLLCAVLIMGWELSSVRQRNPRGAIAEAGAVFILTALAAALRFLVARPNLMDFGGIPYSRMLTGYKGYYGTAQFFSLFYGFGARDIEHAILFNRLAGTLTIPLVYLLLRRLQPSAKGLPFVAALVFAVDPLHILFSASDAIAVFSDFLAAASYAILAGVLVADEPAIVAGVRYLGAAVGLALLTQVRYENLLFLVPAALVMHARRETLRIKLLVAPLAVAAVFMAIYGYESFTFGLSYENPFRPWRNLNWVIWHLVLNPFMALPVLLIGTAAIWAIRGRRMGVLALLPWLCAFVLCISTIGDGHGAARIYANWLILVLPVSSYGFYLMLNGPRRLAKVGAAVALVVLVMGPLLMRDRLVAQHLEMLEHDRFKAALASVPPSVESIIVPDDTAGVPEYEATFELYHKYAMILEGRPKAARHLRLVSLTDYLEHPAETDCVSGACVFFFGLPCMEQDAYPTSTQARCRELLRTHRLRALEETQVVGAPFVNCSIYTGALRAQLCDPAVKPERFTVYQIDD